MFPPKHGISSLLSPLSIFTGAGKVDVSHLKLEFGPYVHIFNDNSPTNTMAQRTTGAIALNSVGNSKGDYRFLNLETDRRVSRHQWTVLPMPQSVIQQVHYLALKDNMPPLKDKCLIFERRPGVPIYPHTLETEALDYLAHGGDGDDADFDPAAPENDVPLLNAEPISLNELHALHLDRVANNLFPDHDGFSCSSTHSLRGAMPTRRLQHRRRFQQRRCLYRRR